MTKLVPIIAPSILAADFGELRRECTDVTSPENGAAEWLHFDIMDGHFVPNIALGPPVVESMRKHLPSTFFDVHLMVTDPLKWVESFPGASQIIFHIEAVEDPRRVCDAIHQRNQRAAVALKPGTPAQAVFSLCKDGLVDMVLVMTVEPGFGGQKFMADMMPKVSELRAAFPFLPIEVDGGLGLDTIAMAAEAGANVIVAGTSVFRAKDRKASIEALRRTVEEALNKTP